ncbi:hypothetical protein BMW22_15865 [Rhizobium leguminosarum]|uniref:Uncharacterized protein n=1 Tax=Rhizobium leguminosarum TaxID=384 RepID=A0A1L3ZBG9_RHILE|nr:hypothetical protein [Rhizobium leguminosarum]API52900.1 hypothetical protein BMW22_15865 [Rhizobium leguminosarum]
MSNAHIDHMEAAVRSLKAQFSVLHGKQSDNEEVVREFAVEMLKELSGLVSAAGGDPGYINTFADSIGDEVDRCFYSAKNPIPADVFKPRAGLLKLIVKGASMR